MANIDYIIPEDIDASDLAVWNSITEDNVGIFQLESDFAWQVFKDTFSKETLEKIRQKNPNVSYVDLMSLDNAIIRPSGASYRGDVVQGNYFDNGHKALNEFLAPTLGRLVYQEQQIEFLVKFCGFTKGMADLVRRGIGKKDINILKSEVPKAKANFIKTMISDYDMTEERAIEVAEPFFQVFMDSANYGFSINHSEAYSWIGYVNAYLRYYYPLEFVTSALKQFDGKVEKTAKVVAFAKSKNIEINDIKYGYSTAEYMMDKDTNSIYQGVKPIKYMNEKSATALYELSKQHKFETFTDLLYHATVNDRFFENMESLNRGEAVEKGSTLPVDSRQMKILIGLNYFSDFGGNNKLSIIYENFQSRVKKTHVIKTQVSRYEELIEFENELLSDEYTADSLSISKQCVFELEYLGHIVTVKESIAKNKYFVVDTKQTKSYTRVTAYQFATGNTIEFKVSKAVYSQAPLENGMVFEVQDIKIKNKRKLLNGTWQEVNEKDFWITKCRYIA